MPVIAVSPSTNSDTPHNRWGVRVGTPDEEINTEDFATDEDLAALPTVTIYKHTETWTPTDNAVTADPKFTWTAGAGNVYNIRGHIITDVAGSQLKFYFAMPSGSRLGGTISSDTIFQVPYSGIEAISGSEASIGAGSPTQPCTLDLILTTTQTGSIGLYWYDNAAGGTLPKIQSGSHLIVTTII